MTIMNNRLGQFTERRVCKYCESPGICYSQIVNCACSHPIDSMSHKKEPDSTVIRFSIPYRTSWGQTICVCGKSPLLGKWNPKLAFPLNWSRFIASFVVLDILSGDIW